MHIVIKVCVFAMIWQVPTGRLFASFDSNNSNDYSVNSHNESSELVDRILKRIAWDQISNSGSGSDRLEEIQHLGQTDFSSGTDEYLSALQSEEQEQTDESRFSAKDSPPSVISNLINRYQLVPLRESNYWKNNPNNLPYSQCILTDSRGNWEVGSQASFVYGQFFRKANGQTLFCYSDLEKTAFMIPIESYNGFSCGLSITFAPYRKISSKLVKLGNKSADQIFGSYMGLGGGLGMLASLSKSVLKNRKNSIELHLNSFLSPGSIDVSLAYKKVEIKPRRLHDFEVYQPQYIQSLAEARKLRQAAEGKQYIRKRFQRKSLKHQPIQFSDIENNDQSKRLAPIAAYWIHTLDSNFSEASYFSSLDFELLAQLKFIKRKKL